MQSAEHVHTVNRQIQDLERRCGGGGVLLETVIKISMDTTNMYWICTITL